MSRFTLGCFLVQVISWIQCRDFSGLKLHSLLTDFPACTFCWTPLKKILRKTDIMKNMLSVFDNLFYYFLFNLYLTRVSPIETTGSHFKGSLGQTAKKTDAYLAKVSLFFCFLFLDNNENHDYWSLTSRSSHNHFWLNKLTQWSHM